IIEGEADISRLQEEKAFARISERAALLAGLQDEQAELEKTIRETVAKMECLAAPEEPVAKAGLDRAAPEEETPPPPERPEPEASEEAPAEVEPAVEQWTVTGLEEAVERFPTIQPQELGSEHGSGPSSR